VYNSFMGYNILHPQSKRRFKAFVVALVKEILLEYPSVALKVWRPLTEVNLNSRMDGSHWPSQNVVVDRGKYSKARCVYCSLKGKRKL
jgi:hypothetical protein